MKKKQFLAWLTAASVCLSAFIAPYPAHTVNAMTILETNVTTASEECTMLGVYGSYYSQAQDGLDRINEIRKEACEAGNVPDPRDSSRTLSPTDYVPLKWSADLERIARIRAAEGGLAFGFLASGHNRLNGKDTFSIRYNGISSSAEDLAYNWGTSMVSGINQWYEEKSDWVNQTSGTVTGHYTSMINPNFTYVGLGDFYTEEASYPNTLAGEFSSTSQDLDETMLDAPIDVMQKIEVKNSYMTDYILEGTTAIYTDKTTALTPKVTLVNGSKNHKLWVIDPITYHSSNTSAATVGDDGVVTGHKNGETIITAQSNGSVLASTTITVKCGHTKELLSTALPTCTSEGLKIYRCEVCGESVEQKIPKTPHSYVYGDKDSEGYRTGICSVCQDTIKIIPPTTYNLWWRNSTSSSNQYSSVFPGSNPISSVIYCWIEGVDGDENYQDMMIESSDESVISVPKTAMPNSSNNQLHVLAPGITTLTIYPKYNPNLKKTLTARIGDPQSVDISTADTVLSQESYPYTGNPCTPEVSVSYHDVLLKEGIDYTLTYENNTEIGTATVIITGNDIFTGTIRKNFTITESSVTLPDPEKKSLDNCTITINPDSFVYDGSPKTPDATVLDGDITLSEGKDYNVSYTDNINVGTAKVILSGIGNYSGTVTKEFTITESSTPIPDPETKPLDNCTITINPDSFIYDGNPKTPDVTVLDGDITLTEGKDFNVSYKNNINAGTATVILSGIGNYSGTVTKEFSIMVSITQKPEIKELSKCTIMLGQTSYLYDGTAKTPSVTVKDGNKVLVKNTDFSFIYKNNINAGTAQIIITGKGTYRGEVTKTFTITIKNGTSHKAGSCQYKVTGTSTVSLTGIKDNKVKKLTIPKTVKIGGKTFKITAIASNALKNNKKITNVQIGDNVKTIGTSAFGGCTKLTKAALGKNVAEIGSNAFKNCRKLNTITIKSTKLKKVGKNAIKGIKPTAKVKVPSKKLSAYKKIFKNKGQGKKVKIVK